MKNKIVKVKIAALAVCVVALFGFANVAYAEYAADVSALDTVAGFETVVKIKGLPVQQAIDLKIVKPDSDIFIAKAEADFSGKFVLTVPETETKTAGRYQVLVNGQKAVFFQVFPGEMDPARSGAYADKVYAAGNGMDRVQISARVTDEFGNPLESHELTLTSSRASDRIIDPSAETDENGYASFAVVSREAGVSIFTVTDESSQEVLSQRPKVVFFKTPLVFKEIGGDPETVLLAQASGSSIAKFDFENLPASMDINNTISFKVRALDATGNVVPSYAGTVQFSSTDPNAQLPREYAFTIADQGQKTFELALSFRTGGSQRLTVADKNNALIKGEKNVEVVTAHGAGAGQVRITKPATGSYSVNTLEIAGESNPSKKVKIFDNGQQIAEAMANSNGRFTHTTSLLKDGQHTFNAESEGVQSDSVTVTIDTTPAQVEHVEISKKELAPGETTEISIRSDPDLDSVQASLGDIIVDLESDPQNSGLYRGTLTAPAQDGEYTVNVIVTDKMGNAAPPVEVGKIRVSADLKPAPTPSFRVPPKVQGVSASPRQSAVALAWQPSSADSGVILYRIYYGTEATKLTLIANTRDASPFWTIVNLKNDTMYYFQIYGMDANGVEGHQPSDIVSAMPSQNAPAAEAPRDNTPPVLCEPGPCPEAPPPPASPEDGPEVLGMVIAALFGSSVWRVLRKKIKD